MKFILGCCVFILVIFLGISAHAGGPLALYDDFRIGKFHTLINPDKWVGAEAQSSLSERETYRQIERGGLHIFSRGYGNNTTDSGGSTVNQELRFTDGDSITAIKATIQVKSYSLIGSTTNPSSNNSRVVARLAGYFFNTGTPTPNSGVNDVWAHVGIRRNLGYSDPLDTLRVEALVFLCGDSDCYGGTVLATQSLGTIKVGKATTVRIEWDKANHRFLAQRDNGPEVLLPYAVPDTSPPGLSNHKRIETQYVVVNSTSNPRPMAFVDAFFSNVYVNKSAMSAPMKTVADDTILLEHDVADEAGGR